MTGSMGLVMLGAVATLLIATGLPAWIVLIGVALAFAVAGLAFGVFTLSLLTAIPARLIGLLENDLLQALPLYVLMGALLHHLPLAQTLYRVGSYALHRSGAGAALAGLGLGALLAPMNGSVGASVAMLGRAVLPRLDQAGLPGPRSAALVCVASTLGVVVPPSLVLILLADAMMRAHTEATNTTGAAVRIVNTQDIFVGALFPAAVLLALYVFVTWTANRRPVRAMDRPARPTAREWTVALMTATFIVGLLLTVTLGYLYAVEAAAAGGVVLVVWGIATRTLTRRVLRVVLADTIAITGALFALLVGATTFTLVVRAYGTDRWIAAVLAALPGGAPVTLSVVLASLGLCALVLDAFELIFVVVHILMPPLLMQVADATWVAVLVLLILQLGFVTPPFGYAVLMIRKHLPRPVATSMLARSLAPYVVAQLAVLALTLAHPALVWHRNPSELGTTLPGAGPSEDDARRMLERQLQPRDDDAPGVR
jgi:tripartite ATP-independent transporter DctM subunit